MARKKATPIEEGSQKEEVPYEQSEKWSEPSGGMVSQEALGHLMRAATEFMGAMDNMMPKKKVPEEVKVHARAAKREVLLMARAMLDAKIAECDASQAKPEEEPRVRKINLD
jgi:hypothetical protein